MSQASLDYPFERPDHGQPTAVTGGVRWLRLPLPFALDHINLWWLEGAGERVLVDTGIASEASREHWRRLLGDWAPGRILITHYHPDHMGLAQWLQNRTGAQLAISEGELTAAQRIMDLPDDEAGARLAELFGQHGLDAKRLTGIRQRGNTYRPLVDGLPRADTLMCDGDSRVLGGETWRTIIGGGHAPEHVCLYRARDHLLIAGDQLLPRITSNISVGPAAPEADPLADYLASLATLETLPQDTLVLPSHGRPFRGLHQRTAQIRAHHRHHLEQLVDAADRQPLTAADTLPILFRRRLDAHSLFFAMGEAIAHLNHLWHQGELERTQEGGVLTFVAP